jgi:hypothetical protein
MSVSISARAIRRLATISFALSASPSAAGNLTFGLDLVLAGRFGGMPIAKQETAVDPEEVGSVSQLHGPAAGCRSRNSYA